MSVYIVLRHQDAEPLWANSWIPDTPLIEAITTDATVAARCRDAQQSGAYVYVHRCAHGNSPASVVSKAKVRDVQKVDRTFHLILFTDQIELGLEPPRSAEQGDRSYIAPPVDDLQLSLRQEMTPLPH
jgi:hypothetical protein